MGLVQWGVLDETETGVYGAIALEEAIFYTAAGNASRIHPSGK